jgi:hypothetical protein
MFGSRSSRESFMIPVTTLCIVIFAERQAQVFLLYYFKILIKFSIDNSGVGQASFTINRFIFSEEFCKEVLFFGHRGYLQALKVCDLKFV